jgi:hypothetical protein
VKDGRRARAALVLAVLVLVGPWAMWPGVASGAPRTYVTHDCTGVDIRPRSIMFTCADGGFYVKRLEWRSWHRFRAAGHGVFHRNDCDPSCAGGTFHTKRGRLVLRRRRWCPDIERYVFARVTITYRGSLLGRHRESRALLCPF